MSWDVVAWASKFSSRISFSSGLDGGRDAFASGVETQHSSTSSALCMVLQLELQKTDTQTWADSFNH